MSKLIYVSSFKAYKSKYTDWEQSTSPVYRSIAYTADGYIITHGKAMKTSVEGSTNPWGLDLSLSGQKLTVTVSGQDKSVTLPIIGVSGEGVLSTSVTNGVATVAHALGNSTWTGDQTIGPNANSSSSITVPQVIFDKYGHYKSVTNRTATLNNVSQTLNTDANTKYLLFGTSATTATAGTQFSTLIKAVASTGTLYATIFNQNGKTLDNTYAPILHASTANTYGLGNTSNYGHVKLSDSTTVTTDVTGGTAATPKAVNSALTSAKTYADGLFASNDALIFAGTINASTGVIITINDILKTKHNIVAGTTKITELTTYSAGWTFKVATAGTIANIGVLEIGDMVVATSDCVTSYKATDWSVIQTNINGAVTSANALADNSVILGGGNKAVKSLANGSNGQVLKILNNVPTWATDNTTREIQINGLQLLAANNSTAFNIASGTNVTLTSDVTNGKVTIAAKDTTYSAGEGLKLTGTEFSLNKATSSVLGGIKIGYTTANKNYAVQLDTNGNAFVAVPWTDNNTTYSVGTYNYAGLIKPIKSYTAAATGITASTSNEAVALTAITTTTGRYYAVEMDANGVAFVNVPWVDTNTTYSYKTWVGASGSNSNATTTNGNTYLKLYNGTTAISSHKISGAGSTSVTSDANGHISISSINSWRNIKAPRLSDLESTELLTTSISSNDLEFSSDFAWTDSNAADAKISIVWTEVAEDGSITYAV